MDSPPSHSEEDRKLPSLSQNHSRIIPTKPKIKLNKATKRQPKPTTFGVALTRRTISSPCSSFQELCIIALFLRHFEQGPHLRSGTSMEQRHCCGSGQWLRASALPCFWPGRYSISKWNAERISIHRAIRAFGSLKLKSQQSA